MKDAVSSLQIIAARGFDIRAYKLCFLPLGVSVPGYIQAPGFESVDLRGFQELLAVSSRLLG